MDNFQKIFEQQKKHFHAVVKLQSINDRIVKLKRLKSWIINHQQDIRDALHEDFHKPQVEADITDIKFVLTEIDHACKNLKKWTRPKKVSTPLFLLGTRSKIIYEPKGVVLIIVPWNFPFMLPISPLVSAIAAGNSAIIKPSELSPNTSQLVGKMIAELFSPDEVHVFLGDEKAGHSLINLPFDHIFFTGSDRVGKIVMQAAAKNLTSVTLELGGQNPVIVDQTAKVKEAAERIVLGKFFNAGQSCVSPNTIYVHESVKDNLVEELKSCILNNFPNGYDHPDYVKIINQEHYHRLNGLVDDAVQKGAHTILNENTENTNRIFTPTILTDIHKDSKINNEEIFGPILVVVTFKNINEVIKNLIRQPKPLALYIYSQQKKRIDYIIKNITSGTVAINDTSVQFLQKELPFGGVNNSGIGKAHGYYGFLDFSNQRSILKQKNGYTGFKLLNPPYTSNTKKIVNIIMKYL